MTGQPAAVRAAPDTLSWSLLDAMLKAAPRETLARVAGLTVPFESQLSPRLAENSRGHTAAGRSKLTL